MLVLCHANGDPVQVGDKVTLRSGEDALVEQLAPGHPSVLVQTPDGSAWLPIHHCGLIYMDRQVQPELTVHDRYVLALLPVLAAKNAHQAMDSIIEHAFSAADRCMKRRK